MCGQGQEGGEAQEAGEPAGKRPRQHHHPLCVYSPRLLGSSACVHLRWCGSWASRLIKETALPTVQHLCPTAGPAPRLTPGHAWVHAAVPRQLAVPAQLLLRQVHPLVLAVVVQQQGAGGGGVVANHLAAVPLAVAVKQQGQLPGWGGWGWGRWGESRVAGLQVLTSWMLVGQPAGGVRVGKPGT